MNGARLALAAGSGGDPPGWVIRPDLGLFAIASSVGRMDETSRLLDAFVTRVAELPQPPPCELARMALEAAVASVSEELMHDASADASLRGVGATWVAVLVTRSTWLVAHMGDCRAHLIRRDGMLERTLDHTLVAHPHVVVRAVGMSEAVPDFQEWHLESGDICLLTAGVHHHLSDAAMTRTLRAATTLDEAVNELVARAARAGATDTITAVLVRA